MAADPRLKGQEVVLRILQDGDLVDELQAVGSFNDEVTLEIKEDGFLGESVNRVDQILNGFKGDLEFQVNSSSWLTFVDSVVAKAKREAFPTFNVVRTDLFVNGQTAVITYTDVAWGAIPTTIGGRAEYAKVKLSFACSDRTTQVNAI
jgi:hypothetical protein